MGTGERMGGVCDGVVRLAGWGRKEWETGGVGDRRERQEEGEAGGVRERQEE